jgi:hypothetical protein
MSDLRTPTVFHLSPTRYVRLTHTPGDTGLTVTESYDPHLLANSMYGFRPGESHYAGQTEKMVISTMVDSVTRELRDGNGVHSDGECVCFRTTQIPPLASPDYWQFCRTLYACFDTWQVTGPMIHFALRRILKGSGLHTPTH